MADETFDPAVACCINGCGELAAYSELSGMVEDGTPVYELHCGRDECTAENRDLWIAVAGVTAVILAIVGLALLAVYTSTWLS